MSAAEGIWLSFAELAAARLPGLPTTRQAIAKLARRSGWLLPAYEGGAWRRRAGRGGGVEIHHRVLPEEARAALLLRRAAAGPRPAEGAAGGELWAWFERQPERLRARAQRRLDALRHLAELQRAGMGRLMAVITTARQMGVSRSQLYAWEKLVEGRPLADWLPALAPRHAGGRARAEVAPEIMEALLADYLRPEAPAFEACLRRVRALAAEKGWPMPAARTLLRRVMEIPEPQRILKRQGEEALRRLFPAQQRDRGVFHALEAVNADGHSFDLFVRWPDGTVARPQMVAFQDLYSGKILSWRAGQSLSWHEVRLAFGDLVERYGIPSLCFLDNGREFAAKRITGGQANRYRWRLREEEPAGLLTTLGVEVRWTTPYRGQSKPIERAFRDFAENIAKHPAFAGAYTGNSPVAKPENYGARAVPLEEFLRVLGEGIAEHNARPGRRSPTCAGRSFDATFAESYASAPIRRASAEQRRLWLMAAEAVRVRSQDGTIHLFGNRYWGEFLLAERGRQVVARFDPAALAEPLHVYAADGRYLGAAECLAAAGFDSVEAAREQARRWKQFLRATKEAAAAQQAMDALELARRLPRIEAAEPPEPRVVRPLFAGNAALRPAPLEARAEEEARVLRALAFHHGRAAPLRVVAAEDEDE